jgi:hypothetical protein
MVRGLDISPDLSKLYVPSRTGTHNIFILDALTGDSLGKLDMTGVSGGTYNLNLVGVAEDGAIYATNLALINGTFKLYRWADDAAVPTVAFEGTVVDRCGDSFAVIGEGVNTKLYVSGSTSPNVYLFTTTDGTTFTHSASIPVTAGLARGGLGPVGDGSVWVNGSGTAPTLVAADGTVIASLSTSVVSGTFHDIRYLELSTGEKLIVMAGGAVEAVSRKAEVWNVTDLEDYWLYASAALTNVWNANVNGTGAALMYEGPEGDLNVVHMVSNNGIAAYSVNEEPPVPPVDYDIFEDFADASDIPNWRSDNSGFTVRAQVDGMMRLSDGGWTFDARRDVQAEPNTFFRATAKIMTVGSFSQFDNQYLYFGIDGLGDQKYEVSCVSDSVFTTFTIVGYAVNETGTLYIAGQGGAGADTVYVDEYSYENNYVPGLNVISTVAEARAVPVGQNLATIGVVTVTNHFGTAGPVFIQDETAGYAVYNYAAAQSVELGDEILVIGTQKNYNGLLELDPTFNHIVLSKGNTVEPVEVTADMLDGEAYEGQLVIFMGVDTLDTGLAWPEAGKNLGIYLKDKNDSTFFAYLDKDTDIPGSPKPTTWPMNIMGVVSDYNGPQLMPRSLADFIPNNVPGPFEILNPADGLTITSLDDPAFVDQVIGDETVKTLFINWTEAVDPDEGDVVTYEVVFYPGGPEEPIVTTDTVVYIPIDEETPWSMNGTYNMFVKAVDLAGATTLSDTITITMDFPAPPEILFADVVLVDGTPKLYAMFNMDFEGVALENFMIVDKSTETAAAPTALDSIAPNAVMLSGNLVEDHYIALAYNGIVAPGGTVAATDTAWVGQVLIPFSDNHPEDAAGIINDFEASLGTWKAPTFSGSTTGILTTSSFAISDEEAFRGEKSAKLTLLDDPAKQGGFYVRLLHNYPFTYTVKSTSTLMFMVKGTNAELEMRISVTENPGYEQGPWQRVTLSEDDWQVVSFDLAHDPVEGWVNGNGVIDKETVEIEGIHMRCAEDIDIVLYIDEFIERQVVGEVDVTFNVNMKKWIADGLFDVSDDFVDVAGTMNGWGGTMMADEDGDSVYSVVIPLMNYSTHEFKFRINGSWDTSEFPGGGPNRVYTVGDSTGNVVTYWYNNEVYVGIDNSLIPDVYELGQNYPNPFNPTTTIPLALPEAGNVKMIIYDITGRQVMELYNGFMPAGYHNVNFAVGRIPSGMYIYRVMVNNFTDVKKMTILK